MVPPILGNLTMRAAFSGVLSSLWNSLLNEVYRIISLQERSRANTVTLGSTLGGGGGTHVIQLRLDCGAAVNSIF